MSTPSTSDKFNARSPSVKRVMQEIREMAADQSSEYLAVCMEDDIFEWHFVIRGPNGSEFEGGLYHGRILLPPDYPMKPPAFQMLTPSGRFEVGVKICLSISSHHPEAWQPSWSVRTALTALIAFMPSPANGSVGSLDYTKEERAKLAAKARLEPPSFGSVERQALIKEMHAKMLQRIDASSNEDAASSSAAAAAPSDPKAVSDPVASRLSFDSALVDTPADVKEVAAEEVKPQEEAQVTAIEAPPPPAPTNISTAHHPATGEAQGSNGRVSRHQSSEQGLTILAWALVASIFAILVKKIYYF